MEPLNLVPELIREMQDRLGCHSVILYGSLARGVSDAASDIDLVGFRDIAQTFREAGWRQGLYVDLFIYSTGQAADEAMLCVRGGKVLCQRDSFGDDFLERLERVFQLGPVPLPDYEKRARKVWAFKMLARARKDDPEGHYRRSWLLTALLEDYFRLRDQWYLGPKQSFKILREKDLDTDAAFAAALEPGADLQRLEELVKRVTGEVEPSALA